MQLFSLVHYHDYQNEPNPILKQQSKKHKLMIFSPYSVAATYALCHHYHCMIFWFNSNLSSTYSIIFKQWEPCLTWHEKKAIVLFAFPLHIVESFFYQSSTNIAWHLSITYKLHVLNNEAWMLLYWHNFVLGYYDYCWQCTLEWAFWQLMPIEIDNFTEVDTFTKE